MDKVLDQNEVQLWEGVEPGLVEGLVVQDPNQLSRKEVSTKDLHLEKLQVSVPTEVAPRKRQNEVQDRLRIHDAKVCPDQRTTSNDF